MVVRHETFVPMQKVDGSVAGMIVVPFIALCFSAPVAMLLSLIWLGTSGHSDLTLLPKEAVVLAASTASISFALAVLSRMRRR